MTDSFFIFITLAIFLGCLYSHHGGCGFFVIGILSLVSHVNLPFHLRACMCTCHLFILALLAPHAGCFFTLLPFLQSFIFPPKYPFISSLPLCPFLPSSSFPHPSLPPTLFAAPHLLLSLPPPVTRQHWDEGGGDPEEPERLAAGA